MNEGLLFADDAVIWKRGFNISHIIGSIQRDTHILEQWGLVWGFKFSVLKSQVTHFTRKKVPENQEIMLYNHTIEKSNAFKYLGVWLDSKLTWKLHIEHVETKCKKVLNLMRMISGLSWGADK